MARPSSCTPVVVVQCPSDCPDAPTIELSNINLNGIGVLDSWDGINGAFRGVVAANTMIGVTLDGTNHTITLTPSISAIATAFPAATESVAGKIEIATTLEVNTGTNDATAVSPLKLAAKNFLSVADGATTTMSGAAFANLELLTGSGLTITGDGTGAIIFDQNDIQVTNGSFQLTSGTTITTTTGLVNNAVVGTNGTGVAVSYLLNTFYRTTSPSTGSGNLVFDQSPTLIDPTVSGELNGALVMSSGSMVVTTGDFEVFTIGKGVVLKSPDGTSYRIVVANGGALSTVAA